MADIGDRLRRLVRSNLNTWLDRVESFEEEGGFDRLFERWEAADPDQRGASDGAVSESGGEKTIREYYANLEVPYGADLEEVKASYRELMRQYHPDQFRDHPELRQRATELTQELTRAYERVRDHIRESSD